MQSAMRSTLRLAANGYKLGVRRMSSNLSHEEEVKEMNKWRIITLAAIPVCVATAIWDLSQEEHHEHEKPSYPYLNIRSKEFPWGDCPLFDTHCGKEESGEGEGEE